MLYNVHGQTFVVCTFWSSENCNKVMLTCVIVVFVARPDRRPVSQWGDALESRRDNATWQHQEDAHQVLCAVADRAQVSSTTALDFCYHAVFVCSHVVGRSCQCTRLFPSLRAFNFFNQVLWLFIVGSVNNLLSSTVEPHAALAQSLVVVSWTGCWHVMLCCVPLSRKTMDYGCVHNSLDVVLADRCVINIAEWSRLSGQDIVPSGRCVFSAIW